MIPITRSSITLARAATGASAPAFAAGLRQAAYPTARAWSSTPAVSAKGKTPDKLKPGQLDEHARIFDPDSRKGTAAEAVSEGGDVTQSRPTHVDPAGGNKSSPSAAGASNTPPAPDVDAGSAVDPGYDAPSSKSDPFPLPYDSSINLSSESQSDSLEDYGSPLRVPGRDPGQESREQRIRRLIYQTRKRGILETDLLMSTFAQKELWNMSEGEIEEFDRLLDEPDWDLYYWLVQRKPVPARWKESFETPGRLGARLRLHTKNEDKEVRFMPNDVPVEKDPA